jgi:hypothetical protein
VLTIFPPFEMLLKQLKSSNAMFCFIVTLPETKESLSNKLIGVRIPECSSSKLLDYSIHFLPILKPKYELFVSHKSAKTSSMKACLPLPEQADY